MIRLTQPNPWSCFATAFAMVLEIPVERFFELVGHDGSEEAFPDLPPPCNRRGIHPQEAIEACWKQGYYAVPFEAMPLYRTMPGGPVRAIKYDPDRLIKHMRSGQGVLACTTKSGKGHALAFNNGIVCDPDTGRSTFWDGDEMEQRELTPFCLWRIGRR